MALNEEQQKAATHPEGEAALLLAGAGSGKCLGPEVPVLMYDGSTKQAQHVRDGDLLIGPDGLPRLVSGTTSGTEEMFEITPVKGETWTCNRSHILSLYVSSKHKQKTYGEYVELTIDQYLAKSENFKRKVVKLWRSPALQFTERSVPIDPWFLGLWLLGDGNPSLSTTSIAKAARAGRPLYATNPLSEAMRELGLHENKHIPMLYLRNSISVRQALLAGLIEMAGFRGNGSAEIPTKFPRLCEDILWLARSLGFAAYKSVKTVTIDGERKSYARVSISGDMSNLPVVLMRKQAAPRRQIKPVRVTGFTVRSLGNGQYNGFKVDRDGLFLLGDFTVTHNTTTLTERISLLIERGVPSRKILALTFTNKAAQEIRERVLKRTGLTEEVAPRITTIHSLALSLIRRNPQGFGLGPKVSPLSDYDQNDLLKRIVAREEIDTDPYRLRDKISYHRARGIGFRVDYTPDIHKIALQQHAGYHALDPMELKVWELFEKEKAFNSAIDFDDMLHFVNRRAAADPEWLVKLQAVFAHVLMDESQDTSVVAWTLVNNLLGPDNRNLFCVGDVSQSIMSFNGSQPQLIMDFANDWRGHAPVLYRLQRNHRSVPEVVNFANAIQEKMTTNTLPLKMHSFRGESGQRGKTSLLRSDSPQEIARRIAFQITESRGALRDFAILVRSSSQVRDLEGELVRARIPYVVRGGSSLLQTEEVRDILSYIRFATNTKDLSALSRSISAPRRGLGDAALEKVRELANRNFNGDLLLACAATGNPKFAAYANITRAIQSRINNPVDALNITIGLSTYTDYLRKKYAKDPEKVEQKIENLQRLRMMIEGLSADSDLTTEDLIFQLTMDKADREDDERGVVTISTIHSAKGLEWPVVFVFLVNESQLPHWRSVGSEEECDEERRLFYVAVTRARDRCILCIAERVQRGKYLSVVEPSRFLTELGIE